MGYGKKYRSVNEKLDLNNDYELDNAIAFLQENPTAGLMKLSSLHLEWE